MQKILLVTEVNDRFEQTEERYVPAYATAMISRFFTNHDLEVLLVDDKNVAEHIPDFLAGSGRTIRTHRVAGREIEPLAEETLLDDRRFIFNSQKVYKFLQEYHYDVVIMDVRNGYGFVPTRAKKMGLDLGDTVLVSWLRTCHEFERDLSLRTPDILDNYILDRQRDFAEQYGCENSDVVLVQAEAILEWSRKRNWAIDEKRVVRILELDETNPVLSVADRFSATQTCVIADNALKSLPTVSVCVPHFNDGHNLIGLLKSLDKNSYENFEVLVVDDGSSDAESLNILKQLESTYSSRNWRFIFKEENESIGPTRNFAVSQAKGEIIIFMDSDNLATSDMVFDFVRGIESSGADCLTCAMIIFSGNSDTVSEKDILCCRMPIGPCLEAGIYFNEFGDANFCVRKSVFIDLGGFTGSRGEVADDWEFLARLFLAGYKLDVVPKPVFFYRVRQNSWLTSAWSHHSVQALRKKIVSNTNSSHQEIVHDMLLEMIAENERLREAIKDSDRKIVRIAIRLSNMISPQKRVAFQKLTGKLLAGYSNSFIPGAIRRLTEILKHRGTSFTRTYSVTETTSGRSAVLGSLSNNCKRSQKISLPQHDNGPDLDIILKSLPKGKAIFGFVADLTDENRPLGFLRLAYWMQMFGDNSHFLMVGDGPLSNEVETTVKKYKLRNFSFSNGGNATSSFYRSLTGFVVTTSSEIIPNEMLEALSFGIPVFCSCNAKVGMLLRDFGSGFSVNHDPEKKDFADCFLLWKENIAIYRAAALESAKILIEAQTMAIADKTF